MINSSIANIQTNKSQINTMDTQLSTQKKINKPSDDPIIAIRALRLRSSLDQVTQYINKNIPDASSWLSVTHDALDQSYNIVSQLYSYCNQGATDSYSPSERNTIVETLNKLKDSFYTQGDVDYAGRYVFTGYATDKPLTYQSDADAKDVDYTITQNFTRDALSSKTVYTNAYSNDDIMNLSVKKDANGKIITPNVQTVHRLQIGQSVVSRAAGVISSDTAINIDTMISTMETAMESMEIGELVILALETMLVSLCMKIISVFITVILYGRMIDIYLYSSVGAIPFATMSNREWGQIGNNYLRGLFALAFQGFFMMVCVGIYAVLVANIQMSDNIHSALFGVMAYTVILCFSLMKTGNFARSIFNAH